MENIKKHLYRKAEDILKESIIEKNGIYQRKAL